MDFFSFFLLIIIFFGIIGAFCRSVHSYFTNVGNLKENVNVITFDIDCGGLNNIRLQLELLVALAWLSGRTLVLPVKIGDMFDIEKLKKRINISYTSPYSGQQTNAPEWGAEVEAYLNPEELEKHKNERVWHFYCGKNHRLLSAAECYFSRFENLSEIMEVIRESVIFKPEFFKQADENLKKIGLTPGKFNAIHIRNWENRSNGTPQYNLPTSEDIVTKIRTFDPKIPVLVLSQDIQKGKPKPINVKGYKLVKPPHGTDELQNSIVDMIMASKSLHFIGTPLSTYSTGIMSLRGSNDIDFIGEGDFQTCKEDSWNFHIIQKSRWKFT